MRFKASVASLLVVLATVAALSPTRVAAEEGFTNTEHLLKWCKQPETSANHAYCVGYIEGVSNMMVLVGTDAQGAFRKNVGMCYPDPPPSVSAVVQAFINWAERNPKHWADLNVIGVVVALSQTWPCTAEGKPVN